MLGFYKAKVKERNKQVRDIFHNLLIIIRKFKILKLDEIKKEIDDIKNEFKDIESKLQVEEKN